ncbi:uncharacterized protein OGAPODRAFT_83563 [Ogataea polymorpha]|uniref:uncharacterized protein n=1 Tax=Ogataea polymorpha TaxID=460523 RepID=UPI0007F536C8|nr:uncharacterized protein OGAPODRAFT_83563 [Ogataea polymorpha]OBA14604.1 hypothetical protein OGAPODRAFT_83563 [Ogataea polymorpha]
MDKKEQKLVRTTRRKRSAGCLSLTYLKLALEVIRSWPAISAIIRVKEPPPLDYLDDISHPVVEEKQVPLRSTDRTLLESFLFNYSIILVLCQKEWLLELGSPFDIFNEFRPFLKTPLYQCPVPWMNNPMVGVALCAIELVAKASWLWHYYLFNPQHEALAVQVHSAAKYFIVSLLPPDVKFVQPKHVRRKLEDSSKDLEKLAFHSQTSSICTWLFAVIGTSMIHQKDQNYLMWRIENFASALRISCFWLWKGTWGTKGNPGQGWNVLLKKNCFKKVMF